MLNRRRFLQSSGLISLSPFVPAFLPGTLNADVARTDGRSLVVIQLDGGNDGLNTVIPYTDDHYEKYRKELRIDRNSVRKLNDSVGLHPTMSAAAKLFEKQQFAVVQGVGYPNPNRSHFESMAIWHGGRTDTRNGDQLGWLGRAADRIFDQTRVETISIGDENIPAALKGRRTTAISLERETDLALDASLITSQANASDNDLAAFVTRTQAQSFDAAKKFDQSTRDDKPNETYPATKLGQHLQLVSRMLKLGIHSPAYYVSQGGYDTHSGQLYAHRDLLREFSDAVAAFLEDLKGAKLGDQVVVLAFSEFGRRVQENGSAGTDHGAAGPVFLAGEKVCGGVVGEHPSLSDLDQGDLKMSIDFRRIYATLLKDWLGIDAEQVLGGSYSVLNLFHK